MLGFIAGCFAWGALKQAAFGGPVRHSLADLGLVGPIVEELQFRTGLERMGLRRVMSPGKARILSSIAFATGHQVPLDAALGGFVYSHAYDRGGLLGSIAAHASHNLGVWAMAQL